MFGREKKDTNKLENVQKAVAGAGTVTGVRNLSVQQDGNVLKIVGQADSLAAKQAAFQKITSSVGDASGVVNFIELSNETTGQVRGAGMQAPPVSGGTATVRTHVVKKGETLSHIAQQYYGKASEYPKIFEANRDQLSDPDKIREGMTLRLPA